MTGNEGSGNSGPGSENEGHGSGGQGPDGHGNTITITVDGTERKVRERKWVVSELKAELGIDPARVLAEITPNGLQDLDDAASITLNKHQKFMTHARSGGSS